MFTPPIICCRSTKKGFYSIPYYSVLHLDIRLDFKNFRLLSNCISDMKQLLKIATQKLAPREMFLSNTKRTAAATATTKKWPKKYKHYCQQQPQTQKQQKRTNNIQYTPANTYFTPWTLLVVLRFLLARLFSGGVRVVACWWVAISFYHCADIVSQWGDLGRSLLH